MRLGAAAAVVSGAILFAAAVLAAPAHERADERASEHAGSLGDGFARTEAFDFDPPRPGTYRLPPIKLAPDGGALDSTGAPVTLHGLMAGRIALLSFVYTRCSDAHGCPLAMGVFYELHDLAQESRRLRDNLTMLTMSFDPAHDTPDVMRQYRPTPKAGADRGRVPWHFLTAPSVRALTPILDAYGQTVDRRGLEGRGGEISHLLRVYLIDRERRVRNIYGADFLDPRLVVNDIETLLMEERKAAR